MKKFIALFLSILGLFFFTACGNSRQDENLKKDVEKDEEEVYEEEVYEPEVSRVLNTGSDHFTYVL